MAKIYFEVEDYNANMVRRVLDGIVEYNEFAHNWPELERLFECAKRGEYSLYAIVPVAAVPSGGEVRIKYDPDVTIKL